MFRYPSCRRRSTRRLQHPLFQQAPQQTSELHSPRDALSIGSRTATGDIRITLLEAQCGDAKPETSEIRLDFLFRMTGGIECHIQRSRTLLPGAVLYPAEAPRTIPPHGLYNTHV